MDKTEAIRNAVGADEIKCIVVHGGVFHADDVLCAAMAREINPDARIERTNTVPESAAGVLIADIGSGRYDHHQADAAYRPDTGEKYASCGLVFEVLHPALFPNERSAKKFEREYVIPIELSDNGVAPNPLSAAIAGFVPEWDSARTMEEGFRDALSMMQGILHREIEHAASRVRAEDRVREAFNESDGITVVLPRYIPWQDVLIQSTAQFVIYKSDRGGYNLQTVPECDMGFTAKRSLPREWLENAPAGCTFVHAGLFLAAFEDERSALDAARAIYY